MRAVRTVQAHPISGVGQAARLLGAAPPHPGRRGLYAVEAGTLSVYAGPELQRASREPAPRRSPRRGPPVHVAAALRALGLEAGASAIVAERDPRAVLEVLAELAEEGR